MEKLGASVKLVEIKKQIADKNTEQTTKQSEITAKESEIDALIKEILTKKREELKKYNLAKGFKDDNRRTQSEIYDIKLLLADIRYLENDGNADHDSSVSQENTA